MIPTQRFLARRLEERNQRYWPGCGQLILSSWVWALICTLFLVFVDAPHVLQPVDLINAYARNSTSNFDLNVPEVDLQTSEIQDPLLTPRAWWRPNPERTKGIGLPESLTVVRDILKTRRFEVSSPFRDVAGWLTNTNRESWASGRSIGGFLWRNLTNYS